MKKILVLPLLLCLIFCSFLSLDKNLDEFDPDRTAYGSYDHRVVWGSYASSDKAALPQQEVLDSRAVLYSESDMSALMDCQYIEEIPSFPAVICRIRTSSLGFLGRLTSNLSWLGALLQLIHIILFAYAAIVVMRICLTNTSRNPDTHRIAARFYISVSSLLSNDVLNIKHIAELLKCSVCLMCENLLCKNLSKLNTFLIEAVYIP